MSNHNYSKSLKDATEHLRDPFKFRVCVAGVAVVIAYCGVFSPMRSKIDEVTKKLDQETQRESLAQDVDLLRAQRDHFDLRMCKDSDVNEWIQYVLNGVRALPLKLVNLDSEAERKVGPYRAVAMRLAVSGQMHDLDGLLEWVDTNERFIRVDSISIEPERGQGDRRIMQLSLLGLRG